jgi:hypothetical protein
MWCEYARPFCSKMNEVLFEEAERRVMGGFESIDGFPTKNLAWSVVDKAIVASYLTMLS